MRVLLVDDDDILLRAMSSALRQSGIETVSVMSGDEALRAVEEQPVDAVLIDLMMPRMNGIEVIRALQQRRPALRIVLTSSFPLSPGQIDRMGLNDVDFVAKPATPEQLVAAVGGRKADSRPPASHLGESHSTRH